MLKKIVAFFREDKKNDKSRGLTLTLIIMIFGLLAVFFSTYSHDCRKYFLSNLGLSLIVICAAVLSGAFLGFLFGIPRSLQRSQGTSEHNANSSNGSFADNTNLEQISDWLTKIIVGVSLTQLPQIQTNFSKLAHQIALGYKCSSPETSIAFASSIIIFYSLSGFIFSYLWTRINLKEALNGNGLEQLKSDVNENKSRLDAIKKAQFEKEKLKLKTDEKLYNDIIAISKPEQPTVYDDPQKGRWGGKSINNERKLSVKVTAHDVDPEYDIELTVESTNQNKPLTGSVYFFLHDSYPNSVEIIPVNAEGKAILKIESYEAFTVGAVCDDGITKLELDINAAPDVPDGYKYL